jgi:hypothetical protein
MKGKVLKIKSRIIQQIMKSKPTAKKIFEIMSIYLIFIYTNILFYSNLHPKFI